MSAAQEFVDKIKGYRERSAYARQAEEQALLQAMQDMGTLLGELKAFDAVNTIYYPVHLHQVSYVADINDFDDAMTGAHVLIQRDGDYVSKITMILRNDDFELEKIITPASRTVDGIKHWKDETYSRRGDGVELKAQEAIYSTAKQAASMIRWAVVTAALSRVSYGHSFLMVDIPSGDLEAAGVIKQVMESAVETRKGIESRRRLLGSERIKTTLQLQSIWFQAEQELSFLQDLGYKFADCDEPLAITYQASDGGLTIRVSHDFGQYSVINIHADENKPDVVYLSVSDSEGRDEKRGSFTASDGQRLRSELRDVVLNEIEMVEVSWIPEDGFEIVPSMNM